MWGGKLLALWEAGCPYELDPNTLETIGASDIGQWLTIGSCPSTTGSRVLDKALGFGEAHTAHPHAMRGAMGEERLVSWKWSSFLEIPGGPSLRAEFREYDKDWGVLRER